MTKKKANSIDPALAYLLALHKAFSPTKWNKFKWKVESIWDKITLYYPRKHLYRFLFQSIGKPKFFKQWIHPENGNGFKVGFKRKRIMYDSANKPYTISAEITLFRFDLSKKYMPKFVENYVVNHGIFSNQIAKFIGKSYSETFFIY